MNPEIYNEIKGQDLPDTRNVLQSQKTVTHGVTHGGRKPGYGPRRRLPHSAGPYLMRRGRIFYFRKRLPRAGSNRPSKLFLCLSLRTDLPLDAVKRTAALLTVYEREEKMIVDGFKTGTLSQAEAKTVLTEMLRAELARILEQQTSAAPVDGDQLDARIEALEKENRSLRRAARQQDWSSLQSLLFKASQVVGSELPEPLSPDLGRQAISLKKRLNDVEMDVLDGDDVRNRSGLNRMMKAAAALGAPVIAVLSYSELERHIRTAAPSDELHMRVTKPKTRLPWSEERLAQLLASPVYTGCSTQHRRWRRGKMIIRDATYWVPLIVLTLGSRIQEILLLMSTPE